MVKRRILYLLSIGLVLFLNMMYVEYHFMVLLIFILLVPIFSLALLFISRIDFKISGDMSDKCVTVGDKSEIKLTTSGKISVFCNSTEADVSITYSDVKNEDCKFKLNIPGVIDLESKHCRIADVSVSKCRSFDLIKLFCLKQNFKSKTQIAFLPEIDENIDFHDYIDESENLENMPITFKNFNSDQPEGVKEYTPGDRLNTIHWKLSAAKDTLLVKEYNDHDEDKVLIVMEKSNDEINIMDIKYRLVYSFGKSIVRSGREGLLAIDGDALKFGDDNELKQNFIQLMRAEGNSGQVSGSFQRIIIDDEMVKMYEERDNAV